MKKEYKIYGEIIFNEYDTVEFKKEKKQKILIISFMLILFTFGNIIILVTSALVGFLIIGIVAFGAITWAVIYPLCHNLTQTTAIKIFDNGILFHDGSNKNYIPYSDIKKIYLKTNIKQETEYKNKTIPERVIIVKQIEDISFFIQNSSLDLNKIKKILEKYVVVDEKARNFPDFKNMVDFINNDNSARQLLNDQD